MVVPHPVGDPDLAAVEKKGRDIAGECVHALTTPVEELEREFRDRHYPLPPAVMPR
ncbi:MAG: hypothetical protein HYU76_10300 [Betaproteobacteria bacterium]|nr:hypothetical protein [Betaproteobacteria bacterium]